jgi:hypothetical protein
MKSNIHRETTDILIFTSPAFQPLIQEALVDFDLTFSYYLLELQTLFEAGAARLNIFDYKSIDKYDKILYLDTDILINSDINVLFKQDIRDDKIYALQEGNIGHPFWGADFFDNSKYNKELTAFTTGVLLFRNNAIMKELFDIIKLHIQRHINKNKPLPYCIEQPFVVYNALVLNRYDNQLLNLYVENNPVNVNPEKIVYHFPGGPGYFDSKIMKMNYFWGQMNGCLC